MAVDIKKRNQKQQEWRNENRDRINVLFSKGMKEQIKEAAEEDGMSMSNWVETAVLEKLANR